MTNLSQAGYEKIAKVEVEYFLDCDDRIEFSVIWITTKNGDIFERTMKIGESEEQVANLYRKRGYTDDYSHFFKSGVTKEYARVMSQNDNS